MSDENTGAYVFPTFELNGDGFHLVSGPQGLTIQSENEPMIMVNLDRGPTLYGTFTHKVSRKQITDSDVSSLLSWHEAQMIWKVVSNVLMTKGDTDEERMASILFHTYFTEAGKVEDRIKRFHRMCLEERSR